MMLKGLLPEEGLVDFRNHRRWVFLPTVSQRKSQATELFVVPLIPLVLLRGVWSLGTTPRLQKWQRAQHAEFLLVDKH